MEGLEWRRPEGWCIGINLRKQTTMQEVRGICRQHHSIWRADNCENQCMNPKSILEFRHNRQTKPDYLSKRFAWILQSVSPSIFRVFRLSLRSRVQMTIMRTGTGWTSSRTARSLESNPLVSTRGNSRRTFMAQVHSFVKLTVCENVKY